MCPVEDWNPGAGTAIRSWCIVLHEPRVLGLETLMEKG